MVMAALALCVSACTQPKAAFSTADLPAYDTASTESGLTAFAHNPSAY